MMIFCVYDRAAKYYGLPMFLRTKGEALRSFMDEANRHGSVIATHPEDFTLFYLGQYDEQIASFGILQLPEPMANGLDVWKGDSQEYPEQMKELFEKLNEEA